MKKTFNFGKVDYNHSGRKNCLVEVTVELRDKPEGPEFSASGVIWNSRKTYCYTAGQCLDTIKKYVNNKTFNEIHRLWKAYHLNTMHAGDIEQERAVDKYLETNHYDYSEVCKYLESIGLLIHNGYKYGSNWLYQSIDEADLTIINELLKEA